jgi:hypothetical protein
VASVDGVRAVPLVCFAASSKSGLVSLSGRAPARHAFHFEVRLLAQSDGPLTAAFDTERTFSPLLYWFGIQDSCRGMLPCGVAFSEAIIDDD